MNNTVYIRNIHYATSRGCTNNWYGMDVNNKNCISLATSPTNQHDVCDINVTRSISKKTRLAINLKLNHMTIRTLFYVRNKIKFILKLEKFTKEYKLHCSNIYWFLNFLLSLLSKRTLYALTNINSIFLS